MSLTISLPAERGGRLALSGSPLSRVSSVTPLAGAPPVNLATLRADPLYAGKPIPVKSVTMSGDYALDFDSPALVIPTGLTPEWGVSNIVLHLMHPPDEAALMAFGWGQSTLAKVVLGTGKSSVVLLEVRDVSPVAVTFPPGTRVAGIYCTHELWTLA